MARGPAPTERSRCVWAGCCARCCHPSGAGAARPPALLLPKGRLASGRRFGEDHPSLPGHVRARVPSHGHWSGVARTQGLRSGLLCLSFPKELGFSLAEPCSPARAQPWISRAGSVGWPPSHPPTVPRLRRGHGARGFLPASSFRRVGPAGFPAADSARAPPATPALAVGPLAGVCPATAAAWLSPCCLLPSPGDPPGLPPSLHAPGVSVGPTETPCQGAGGWLGCDATTCQLPSVPSRGRVLGRLVPGAGITPFGEGRARSWCPRWAGVCRTHGGSRQSWSLGHSSRSEGLRRSSVRRGELGQAFPPARSENIGTLGAFFPGLPSLWSRRAGRLAWLAPLARPTEPRLGGGSCSPSRSGSPRQGESRTWSRRGRTWSRRGGPARPPCCLPTAVTAPAGAGELFSTQAGSLRTGAPRRRRTRSAHFHLLLLQVNKHRLARGGRRRSQPAASGAPAKRCPGQPSPPAPWPLRCRAKGHRVGCSPGSPQGWVCPG